MAKNHPAAPAQSRSLNGIRVIDSHGHFGADGGIHIPAQSPEDVLAIMDRIGIDVLCVSHLMSLRGEYRRGNDLLAQAMRAHPGRFVGYAVVDPHRLENIVPELDRCFHELGMTAIKTHVGMQRSPSDGPGYWRTYEYAQAHGGIPVLGHSFGDAATTERIARAFPKVRFIVAHVGGSYEGAAPNPVVEVARKLDNVFVDLCASFAYWGGLEALVRAVGAEKILYASDICYMQATHQIGRVLYADISDRERSLILNGNAAKLFRLETKK